MQYQCSEIMPFNAVKSLLQDPVSNAEKYEDGKKEQKTEDEDREGKRGKGKKKDIGSTLHF